MEFLRIIPLCIAASVAYGILHDQVTVRVCLEYFTVAHPRIIESQDPTLLALTWGIVATWWVGAALGLLLAVAAQVGSPPRVRAAELLRPIGTMMASTAVLALLAGVTGYALGRAGTVVLTGPLADVIAPERHARFLADLWAHSASYLGGLVGGVVLMGWILRRRRRPQSGTA